MGIVRPILRPPVFIMDISSLLGTSLFWDSTVQALSSRACVTVSLPFDVHVGVRAFRERLSLFLVDGEERPGAKGNADVIMARRGDLQWTVSG